MLQKQLEKLGFSPSEITIYMHLLREGRSYSSRISASTGLNRTNVYEALDRLVDKGIVSYVTRNKVKWFQAKAPGSLLTLVQAQEDELQKTRKKLRKEIGALQLPKHDPLEANIFVGKKGLRMIFEDVLEAGEPVSLIASKLQFKEVFGPYFKLWHKKRAKANIRQRTIFPEQFKKKVRPRKFLDYRFVDQKYTNPSTTLLYGDNCILINWTEEPIAIKIQNKEIAKSHQNYFDMLWASA